MPTCRHSRYLFPVALAVLCLFTLPLQAAELTSQEILNSLKAHQDKVQSIQAAFTLRIYGVQDLNIEQTGAYQYTAPDAVLMDIQKPIRQKLKVKGDSAQISTNGGPFKALTSEAGTAGASSDLYYYQFLKSFYLDIDLTRKPPQSNLYRVLAMNKTADGKVATTEDLRNPKAADFIYDRDTGLVTKIQFMGYASMPPMDVYTDYERIGGLRVPRRILAKVITPGGMVNSEIEMREMQVQAKP